MQKTIQTNEPTRLDQIAYMKSTYPKLDNKEIIKELGINKSYFYRLVGRVTKAVRTA